MEHPKLRQEKPDYWPKLCDRRLTAAYRFEELSGEPCYLLHYTRFTKERIAQLKPTLIIFSGHNINHAAYDPVHIAPIMQYFKNPLFPTFCICGSFQLMAQVYGAELAPIGNAGDTDPDLSDPIIPKNMIHENGFCEVSLHQPKGSIFETLGSNIHIFQHHYWEIKSVPEGFKHLCSSPITEVQGIQHESLPLAGVQFHPEDYDDSHPDGRRLLEAVFEWVNTDSNRRNQ